MSKLRSGVELTGVNHNASLRDGQAPSSKPANQYLDGARKGGGRSGNVMNLKSTGFGPSKMHNDDTLPSLLNLEEQLIRQLNSLGTVHLHMLASGVKADLPEVAATMRSLCKRAIVAETTRNGGGFTLMAEGRRIAALLDERRR